MLKNCATAEATAAYAARFAALPGNYRSMLGLSVSSIGIGTYLGEPDDATDAAYAAALREAIRGGINFIDTAVNYRLQRSERVIGKVIAELVAAGEIKREEIVVATKGGYVAFDGEMPADPRAWFEEHYVRTGIVGPGDMVFIPPEARLRLRATDTGLFYFEFQAPNRFKTTILDGTPDDLRWNRVDGRVWIQT